MLRIAYMALNTYRESIRSKILYLLLFFAIAMVLVSALFGSVALGDQIKIIKDFGLFSISFFSVAYVVISGAAFVHKELSRKTVYNILAKPVRRWEFLCGKFFGMLATVALMIFLMGAALLVFVFFFDNSFDYALSQALLHIFFQLIVICALTIFFSSIVVTPLLSGAFAFGVFVAGRSTQYLLALIDAEWVSAPARKILTAAYYMLPHLDILDISNQAVYGFAVAGARTLWCLLYALAYAATLLILATFCFQGKEFR